MQIEAEGATLNYEISGDSSNPALVLWHGAGFNLRMWDTALKGLKYSFFCIAFDIRGAGQSLLKIGSLINLRSNNIPKTLILFWKNSLLKVHVWSMAWGTRAAIAYCSLNQRKFFQFFW